MKPFINNEFLTNSTVNRLIKENSRAHQRNRKLYKANNVYGALGTIELINQQPNLSRPSGEAFDFGEDEITENQLPVVLALAARSSFTPRSHRRRLLLFPSSIKP